MPKLRRTVISQVYATLKASSFSLRDFKVDIEETKELVHVVFLPNPAYSFMISEKDFRVNSMLTAGRPAPPDISLITIESPGDYKATETQRQDSMDSCVRRIGTWCKNIEGELSAPIPEPDNLSEFEAELERNINEATGDTNEKFSDAEIADLNTKLNALSAKFEELKEANTITEVGLAEVNKELQKMRDTLPLYPRKIWYKTAGHKFLDLTKRILATRVGQDMILAIVKKSLGMDS